MLNIHSELKLPLQYSSHLQQRSSQVSVHGLSIFDCESIATTHIALVCERQNEGKQHFT